MAGAGKRPLNATRRHGLMEGVLAPGLYGRKLLAFAVRSFQTKGEA
jgi:hypothetical protein